MYKRKWVGEVAHHGLVWNVTPGLDFWDSALGCVISPAHSDSNTSQPHFGDSQDDRGPWSVKEYVGGAGQVGVGDDSEGRVICCSGFSVQN